MPRAKPATKNPPRPKPERKNAPPGSTVKPKLLYHTAQSLAHMEALGERWGETNANAVVRRALELAEKATRNTLA